MSSVRAEAGHPVVEWQTIALAAVIYGGWLALTWFHAALPWWVLLPAGAVVIAWHGSLQHEAIHGHPTCWRRVNQALVMPPLALWLPFSFYRLSHLQHHRDARLTDPFDDPESYYWTEQLWRDLGAPGRRLVRAQATLLGRLLIGPAWTIGRFFWLEAKAMAQGDFRHARMWAAHAVADALVLVWVIGVCRMSLLGYIAFFVYPGTALSLVRSYAEHRAADDVGRRTAIVENAGFFSLLFLFNNLHVAHHVRPDIPWYRLPRWYARHRATLVARNGGLVYRGYAEVFRRYLLHPHDAPLHPAVRAPIARTGG